MWIILATACIFLAYLVLIKKEQFSGPKQWFIVAPYLSPSKLHHQFYHWLKIYGDPFEFKLFGKRVVVTGKEKLIREILKNRPYQFERASNLQVIFKDAKCEGVFSHNGEEWSVERELISPLFSVAHLRESFASIYHKTREEILEHLRHNPEQSVLSLCSSITQQIGMLVFLGYDPQALKTKNNNLSEDLGRIFPMFMSRLLLPLPIWRYVKTAKDRSFDVSVNNICRIIKQHLIQQRNHGLLESMASVGFSEEKVVGNVFQIFLGSFDTTANLLAWAIFYLISQPEWKTRILEEIRDVDISSYTGVQELRVLSSFIDTILRIHPPTPMLLHEASSSCSVGPIKFQKGDRIFTLNYNLGEKGDLNILKDANPTNNTWLAFGDGPRVCPGRFMAIITAKFVLALLVKNVIFSASKSALQEVQYEMKFSAGPTDFNISAKIDSTVNK